MDKTLNSNNSDKNLNHHFSSLESTSKENNSLDQLESLELASDGSQSGASKTQVLLNTKPKAFKNINRNVKQNWMITIFYTLFALLTILFFCIAVYYDFANHKWNSTYLESNLIMQFEMTIAGVGIGVVGGALQATTRNDLSGPTTLGFMPAIILGIYIPILANETSPSPFWSSIGAKFLFSIIFGMVLLLINFLLTRRTKNLKNNYVPLLVGFAIGVIIAVICTIVDNYNVAIQTSGYTPNGIWGGVQKISYQVGFIEYGAPLTLIPAIIIVCLSKYLNLVEKDPTLAKSMGVNVELIYWVVGILSVIIIAANVLMVGSILLLAIVAPHVARKLFRTTNYLVILPFSILVCMMLLNLSNLVTEADTTIGINLVPILFCAPVFVVLLKKR
ncbi:iron chelate uptake ABC transporter family permease subunit [Ureaplasma ceti]|uniref:Ferrichrome ABC transporter permease n=1 Tax=Ureaplasma ceti TaxID=3119530 RepID=A0ABP9U5V8_9BACT